MALIMTLPSHIKVETMGVYRYASTQAPDDMGVYPAPNSTNLEKIGELECRITPGDSLEPDVLGVNKEAGPDVTTMWIGFSDPPSGFEVYSGDWLINLSDSTRKFQIQFIDRYPGGLADHHYEYRLQTTEHERNA
jgi:hypothetical protein